MTIPEKVYYIMPGNPHEHWTHAIQPLDLDYPKQAQLGSYLFDTKLYVGYLLFQFKKQGPNVNLFKNWTKK